MLYPSMSRPTLATRSRRELQRVRRMRLCVLLVLVLAMPRNPIYQLILMCQLTTNELLRGHVGRLFSLIHMKAATFFALVAWLKHKYRAAGITAPKS
jgi:hypothetical protein